MRKSIKWDTSLNVGIGIIDTQHKIIFDFINNLCNAVEALAEKKIIDTLFDVVENYIFIHFESEEELLKQHIGWMEHKIEHYTMIKEFHKLKLMFRNKNSQNPNESIDLENWFIEHIKQKDIPFFKKISIDHDIVKIEKKDKSVLGIKQKRKHKRINHKKITDGDIIAYCYNSLSLKSSNATVVDISLGGMRISSPEHYVIGDILIISCIVGKNFKMKETIKINNITGNFYGGVFIGLSPATEKFLVELYGSVTIRDF